MRRILTITSIPSVRTGVLIPNALFLFFSAHFLHPYYASAAQQQQETVAEFLSEYNRDFTEVYYKHRKLKYKKYTDSTPTNEKNFKESDALIKRIMKGYEDRALRLNLTGVDESSRRQINFIKTSLTSKEKYVNDNLFRLKKRMMETFEDARVLHNPDIVKSILPYHRFDNGSSSQNGTEDDAYYWRLNEIHNSMGNVYASPEEKLYLWQGYRDALGPNIRADYLEFVRFKNIAARENGYADAGEFKRRGYEVL